MTIDDPVLPAGTAIRVRGLGDTVWLVDFIDDLGQVQAHLHAEPQIRQRFDPNIVYPVLPGDYCNVCGRISCRKDGRTW